MTSNQYWKDEYSSMQGFIAANPGIVLTPTEISIPQEVKEEFYDRFDKVRNAIVEAHYAEVPYDIEALCRHFLRIEKEIISLLGIQGIAMPMDLFSFLHTPKEGLARILYNRLFDLLQGKTTLEAFEFECRGDLRASSAELYRLGYEWWAGLTLIKLMEPDEVFGVDLDEEFNPILTEFSELSFGRQAHHPTLRIPEFVVHSRKLNRFVSVKMAVAKEIDTYVERYRPPVRPKKRTGDTSYSLDSRVMFLSLLSDPKEVPIVADTYDRILNSPDFMLEYITGSELSEPGAMQELQYHLNFMKPHLGMALVLVDEAPDEAMAELPENVHPVSAGFDESKLKSVLDPLA